MISRKAALEIARRAAPIGMTAKNMGARELKHGWYFRLRGTGLKGRIRTSGIFFMLPWADRFDLYDVGVGASAVIVSKRHGHVFCQPSAFSQEEFIEKFDEGALSRYDLRILRIHDRERTLDFLEDLGLVYVETRELSRDIVARTPRRFSRDELDTALSKLPHTFINVEIGPESDEIREARAKGFCATELVRRD